MTAGGLGMRTRPNGLGNNRQTLLTYICDCDMLPDAFHPQAQRTFLFDYEYALPAPAGPA